MKKLKPWQQIALAFIFGYWGFNMLGFLIGWNDGGEMRCREPWRRYEYVAPGLRLGCWFGAVP